MKTSGEMLIKKRKQLGLDLDKIAKRLKIQKKYLEALEENDDSVFDSKVIARGFLVKYADFLNLDVDRVLAFWRRDFNVEMSTTPPDAKSVKYFSFTPRFLISALIFLIFLIFLSIGFYQYRKVNQPPELVIEKPEDNSRVADNLVLLEGKVSAGSEVFLNENLLSTDSEGNFEENIYLSPGINTLNVRAVNEFGIEKEVSLSVFSESEAAAVTSGGDNELILEPIGEDPVYVEVKDSDQILFNGFLLSGVEKSFSGNDISLFTDKVENVNIIYNDESVEIEEKFGNFYREFSK